jgi:hypothetical protein
MKQIKLSPNFLRLFSGKRLLVGTVLLVCLFLVSGGVGAFYVYLFGAESYFDYAFTLTWPFFLLFVFVGFLGLLKTVQGKGSVESLYGLIVVLFCYVCIEVLFKACGGF